MRVAVLAGWLGSATLVDTLDPMRYPIPRSIGVAILGILVGAITTRHVRRNGKLFRWSAAAANTAVVAGFVGAGVGFWTQYGSYNPFLQVGGTWLGGLVGYWAGWWVATRLDVVFGGPDGA